MILSVMVTGFPGVSFAEENAPADSSSPLLMILATRTMSRTADCMVVHGSQMTNNLHKKNDLMALFAVRDGVLEPIPFQIDEINEEGLRVLPNHPPDAKEKKIAYKDDDDGHLDENDEVVFMIRDTGDRIDEASYPEGALAVDEIQIVDDVDGGMSWVYLCSFSSDPPRSEDDYAHYDIENDRVRSGGFVVGFSDEVPLSYDYVSYKGGPNFFDSFKIRFYMKLFGIDMEYNETQFTANLHAYKDGPVRVIRMVRSQVHMTRWLKSPSGYSTTIYLDNSIVMPYTMKIPVNVYRMKSFLKLKVRGGCDFRDIHGWKVKSEADPRVLTVDGKMDELEKSVKTEGARWILASGPEYAMLIRMIFNRQQDGTEQELPFTSDFFYVDDDEAPDPPEFVPGQSPNVGFWMRGLEDMSKGTYFFFLMIYVIDEPFREDMEVEYLKVMDQPVRIVVN